MDTLKMAEGRWVSILTGAGIDENYLRNKHGPCPLCDGKDRFRFDDKDGSGSYYCSVCGAGTGIGLLIKWRKTDFKEAIKYVESVIDVCAVKTATQIKTDPIKRLQRIGQGCESIRGNINPVRLYLKSRSIVVMPDTSVRFNPSVNYYDEGKLVGSFPAMVATLRTPQGEPVTYHVTYLTSSGQKAKVTSPKKMMSAVGSTNGACVRLFKTAEHIAIAEGIETALAFTQMHGIPCWAALGTVGMESFIPPDGVRRITIASDNDANFAGQKAAYSLANRLSLKKYSVDVMIPNSVGDFCDMLPQEQQTQH
jgi:putative DNA primase/helicase